MGLFKRRQRRYIGKQNTICTHSIYFLLAFILQFLVTAEVDELPGLLVADGLGWGEEVLHNNRIDIPTTSQDGMVFA